MSAQKSYKVIIVGAGVAGLSAANYLNKNGINDILILEAKEKAGGRICTLSTGESGERIELGAQWIHGEDNDLCRLVKSSNHRHHKTSWEGKGDFLLPNGQKVDISIVNEILNWLENTIEYVEENISIEDFQSNSSKWKDPSSMGVFLKEKFLKYLEETGSAKKGSEEYELKLALFQWGMSFQRIDNSCNQMSEVSLFRWSEFEINPGEHYNNFKGGASSFVDNILVKSLPQTSFRFNAPVDKITWGDQIKTNGSHLVQVTLRNGDTFSSDSVIVSCSIGVLKDTRGRLFNPELPSKLRNAIDSTGFGPIGKIFLKWDKPWWPVEGFEGFQFLWPKEFINCCDDVKVFEEDKGKLKERWTKSITGFDPVLDNPKVLLGWLGGLEAVFVEGESEREIGKQCAKMLRDFTGFDVPDPDAVFVSKWNSDEFVQGAYSFRSIKGDYFQGDIASALSEPINFPDSDGNEKPVIMLAGEALSKTHYSTIHGAFESGESQAAKIIKYFQTLQKLPKDTENSNVIVIANLPKSVQETTKCLPMQSTFSQDDKFDEISTFSTQFSKKIDVSS